MFAYFTIYKLHVIFLVSPDNKSFFELLNNFFFLVKPQNTLFIPLDAFKIP